MPESLGAGRQETPVEQRSTITYYITTDGSVFVFWAYFDLVN